MRTKCLFVFVCVLSLYTTAQSPAGSNLVPEARDTSSQVSKPLLELPQPYYQADFTPVIANGFRTVHWDNGYLVSYSPGEIKDPVTLWDRSGKPLFENWLPFEGASRTFVQDAVPTPSGNVVVAASLLNADGSSSDLLVEVTPSGIRRVVRTSPFYPERICTSADDTVWAYGHELNQARNAEPREHYDMLREYSLHKGELASALDRATFRPPKGVPVTGKRPQDVQMKCNARDVVLVSAPTRELIEYDLFASHLNRWPLAPLPDGVDITRMTGAALSDSGKIYISTYDAPNVKALTRILELDVADAGTKWAPVAAMRSDGKWLILLGSEGESLVHSRGVSAPTLFWSQP